MLRRTRLQPILLSVCYMVKPIGKPDAGNPPVRFDERGWETERCQSAPSNRAHPRLYISASLSLDIRGADHLAPLFGFVGDQLAEVGRRTGKHNAAEV